MELRQLRYFVTIAKHGSFSRAAKVIYVAQSALSYQVAQLEESLEIKLFHRLARGVALTEAGSAFLPLAVSILRQADDARACLHGTVGNPSGKVTFGLSPSICGVLALALMRAVRQKLPGIDLELTEELTGTLARHLQTGELDLAVLIDDGSLDPFTCIPLLTERLHLISRPSDTVTPKQRTISFKRAIQLPLLLPTARQGVRPLIERCARTERLNPPNVVAEINSIVILRSTLLAGIGNTIQSSMAFKQDLDSGVLISTPIEKPRLTRTMMLCAPKLIPMTAAVAAVRDTALEVVNELVDQGKWSDAMLPVSRNAELDDSGFHGN